jgi:hypothetical protein
MSPGCSCSRSRLKRSRQFDLQSDQVRLNIGNCLPPRELCLHALQENCPLWALMLKPFQNCIHHGGIRHVSASI